MSTGSPSTAATTSPVSPTAKQNDGRPGGNATTADTVTACISASSWSDALQSAAASLATTVGPVVAIARLDDRAISLTPTGPPLGDDIREPLASIATAVFASTDGWSLSAGAYAVRSIVSREDNTAREALVGLVTQPPARGDLSAIAAALSAASSRELAVDRAIEAETAGHILDLTDQLHVAADEADLFARLAEAVRTALAAEAVAVGVRQGERFLVEARNPAAPPLSEAEKRTLGAALDEIHGIGQAVCWPPSRSLDRPARRAFEQAAGLREADTTWAIPLQDARGRVDVILFIWNPSADDTLDRIAAYWNPTLGATVATIRDARASWWDRLKQTASKTISQRGRRLALGVTCSIGAILAVPLPYQSECECRLEPFERRFIAAPFAATLKAVHVEPGDVVEANALLAELDEREIEWELAGIEAERNQAEKRRSAALAGSNLAEAQIAEFDGERLDARRNLLTSRKKQLALRAPIAGIVVDGDLARATGMPLEQGQSLYEVAPLRSFVCELHVPEYDIHDVAIGQTVTISLDSRPSESITGTIRRIRPRAETWGEAVGFVAEVIVENEHGTLRPGMSGDASVRTASHPLVRNLFHRAYGKWRRGW